MIPRSFELLKNLRRIFIKNGPPVYLIFCITKRCICRCEHCFVGWEGEKRNELSLGEIMEFSRKLGNVPMMIITGGEPFLRDDLAQVAEQFCKNNRVRNMQIPSNGALSERVLEMAEEIASRCPKTHFGFAISLDAIGEKHNHIRNFPGLFEKAINTFKGLQELEEKFSNVNCYINITVSSFNQDDLIALYNYVSEILKANNILYTLTRGKPRILEAKNFNTIKIREFNQLVENEILYKGKGYKNFPFCSFVNAKNILARKMIINIIDGRGYQTPCYAGRLAGFLDDEGNIYPCELRQESAGNLRDYNYDFNRIWNSQEMREIVAKIEKERCFCTHECFFSVNLLYNPIIYTKIIPIWFKLILG